MAVESRYVDGSYLKDNPDWDRQDSAWKAGLVASILADNKIGPTSICDVGCGPGDVLAQLRTALPAAQLTGWDISPQLSPFWAQHPAVTFHRGNFHESNSSSYDVVLLLDVIEHVRDPFSFLEDCKRFAKHVVLHFPLDLSVNTILRGAPLMHARRKVGHLHSYTKDLALETVRDSGYDVVDWRYTDASVTSRVRRTLVTQLAALPRRLAYAINKDIGVRVLGGETLLVLAKSA